MYVVLLLFEMMQLDKEEICNDQMSINVTNHMDDGMGWEGIN